MNRKILLGSIIVAMLIAAGIGSAYAYSSSMTLGGNRLAAEGISIDMFSKDGDSYVDFDPQFVGPVTVDDTKTYTLSGYVKADSSGMANAWVIMQNPTTWAIIKSMSLSINGNNYSFGLQDPGNGDHVRTGVPTEAFRLNADQYYGFTLTVVYHNLDIAGDVNSTMKLTFADSSEAPLGA